MASRRDSPNCDPPALARRGSFSFSRDATQRRAALPFTAAALTGVGLTSWERGRPARNAARKRGVTLTLALSHKGRGDPLAASGFDFLGARASRPQRRACARRHPHPSLLP